MAAQRAVGLGSRVDQRGRRGEVILSAQSMHPLSQGFPLFCQIVQSVGILPKCKGDCCHVGPDDDMNNPYYPYYYYPGGGAVVGSGYIPVTNNNNGNTGPQGKLSSLQA